MLKLELDVCQPGFRAAEVSQDVLFVNGIFVGLESLLAMRCNAMQCDAQCKMRHRAERWWALTTKPRSGWRVAWLPLATPLGGILVEYLARCCRRYCPRVGSQDCRIRWCSPHQRIVKQTETRRRTPNGGHGWGAQDSGRSVCQASRGIDRVNSNKAAAIN